MPHYKRATSEYLTAALPLGFEVRHCEELRAPRRDPADAPPPERVLPDHPSDIWTLHSWYPAAHYAANNDSPIAIFWDFELS
jgi:hypothetical protein